MTMKPNNIQASNQQNSINPEASNVDEVEHTQQRNKRLIKFVESVFVDVDFTIDSLAGDASFRRYHRIFINQPAESLDPSYILMDAPPELESIESFVRIDKLMADKINVPRLIAQDDNNGFLMLQDFGSVEFAHLIAEAKVKQDWGQVDALYKWAIDSLLDLQDISVDNAKQSFNVPEYDTAMLQREMELFTEWFLPYINVEMTLDKKQLWQSFTQSLISEIHKQPVVVVHRDYHSRNLMQDQYHLESLGVIDFQDAVIGSYTYDLVSLVRDAYVDWTDEQIDNWVTYYWEQRKARNLPCPDAMNTLMTELNLMGIQRHLKILGIFIRLAKRDGKARYLNDIPKVWSDLMDEISWLVHNSDANIQAFIKPLNEWLQSEIALKFNQTFN